MSGYDQKEIHERILDKAKIIGLEILDVPDTINSRTKLKLLCLKHKTITENTDVSNLLKGVKGCKACQYERVSEVHSLSIKAVAEKSLSTGKYHPDTEFIEIFGKNSRKYCKIRCPVCAKDKYALSGSCDGVFEASIKHLMEGYSPCRCSGKSVWKESHRRFQIKEFCERYGYEFICFNEIYKNWSTSVTLCCPLHGVFETTVQNCCNDAKGCDKCSTRGYRKDKPGYFYILSILGDLIFTGYGITNNVPQRMKEHKKNLTKQNSNILEKAIFQTDGKSAFLLEKEVKSKFTKFSQNVEGFKTEAVAENEKDNLIDFAHEFLLSKNVIYYFKNI